MSEKYDKLIARLRNASTFASNGSMLNGRYGREAVQEILREAADAIKELDDLQPPPASAPWWADDQGTMHSVANVADLCREIVNTYKRGFDDGEREALAKVARRKDRAATRTEQSNVPTSTLSVTHIFDGEEVVTGGNDGQTYVATFAREHVARQFVEHAKRSAVTIDGMRPS